MKREEMNTPEFWRSAAAAAHQLKVDYSVGIGGSPTCWTDVEQSFLRIARAVEDTQNRARGWVKVWERQDG